MRPPLRRRAFGPTAALRRTGNRGKLTSRSSSTEAEHKKRPVIILRHGKHAAALVPVESVPGLERAAPRPMSAEKARELLDELAAGAPETSVSIEEALGRNRLERF